MNIINRNQPVKYAILAKNGGELITAEDADYDDYKDFLKCPVCKEPAFLTVN